jgi:transcriptional regulator of acetoin/glycerol metabolism
MILADRNGFIIEAAGDQRVIEAGRRNHLEEGGLWDEGIIGTNAIGTALRLAQPISITGAEHFCREVQRWSCSAAPIHHPTDKTLLGVVDITGLADRINPESLALAVSLAREIEVSLDCHIEMQRSQLLRHFLAKRLSRDEDDVLIIDNQGFIIRDCDTVSEGANSSSRDELVSEIRRSICDFAPHDWKGKLSRYWPHAKIDVVWHDDDAIGCLISVGARRCQSSSRQPSRQISKVPSYERTIMFDTILGDSEAMREAKARALRLAGLPLSVLIEGETGVGKELFARAIKQSRTPEGPFVPLNCGGMARDLVASELFGYVKGAFTGADEQGRQGKIEQAEHGVLCLDEIGEMPLDIQAYLLRVLEDGVVYRIGGREGRTVDVRFISMTNRDLEVEIAEKRFRRDLYYRIAAVTLRIPPLREREGDILLLANHFAETGAARFGRSRLRLSTGLQESLVSYQWPGNVRELRNVIESMVAMTDGSNQLTENDLPKTISRNICLAGGGLPATDMRSLEKAAIVTNLLECKGNVTKAARRLGIARSTLYLKIAEFGIRAENGVPVQLSKFRLGG